MSPVVHNKIDPQPRTTREEDTLTPAVILNEEGDEIVGVCDGPLPNGHCPWADCEGHLPCNNKYLVAGGFPFKVAEDAKLCPVAVLGLATFGKE
jgi:hypothetical protein